MVAFDLEADDTLLEAFGGFDVSDVFEGESDLWFLVGHYARQRSKEDASRQA